jgi:predicted  nucleic acid-binding Zn-ribbon protein
MKIVMESLLALQELQLRSSRQTAATKEEITRLRSNVPEPILGHFDRLLARGKRGVALARKGVCSECHLKISSGTLGNLPDINSIHLCDSCGRYLYLPPTDTSAPEPTPVPAKIRKPRKRAELALA